jgi:hypothetical protein
LIKHLPVPDTECCPCELCIIFEKDLSCYEEAALARISHCKNFKSRPKAELLGIIMYEKNVFYKKAINNILQSSDDRET